MPQTDRLVPDKIKANLKTKRIGKKILVFKSTSSTNDIAGEYAKNKNNDGLVIFSEEQTKGRGRAGAQWFSKAYQSILCSLLLADTKCSPEMMPLASAIAVAESIGKPANIHTQIKWPNDIILNEKKVAGILFESKQINNTLFYILGIGINCHQNKNSFPAELRNTATSIDIESSTVCDRNILAKRLLTSINHWLEIAQKNSKIVTQTWRRLSIQLGHRVKLLYNGKDFAGNCIGLDPQKGLILQLDTGGIRMFDAAHTTIIK